MISLSSNAAFSGVNKRPPTKFGEASQHALSSELITAWDKTSQGFIDHIKPTLPEIQKESKAFNEAAQKGDQKAAQKHFEASIDRINALVSNTLQAMKLKFPEIMALQQASPEQKKQIAQHINQSISGKFQELAMQTAKANAPKLQPDVVALLDKATTSAVDAMKSDIPAFIKARQDFETATQKFMAASEKSMNETLATMSKEVPESLKNQGFQTKESPLDYNRQVAEYSRQLTRQKLQQATQELMKNTQSNSRA
jgi:hypothetical protein